MNKEKKCLIRGSQILANIPPDSMDLLLCEVEPRNEVQEKYKNLLQDLLDGKIRTLTICGTEGTGKTFIACAAVTTSLVPHVNGETDRIGYYITQSEMNMMFRSAMHGGESEYVVFKRFCEYSFLVIDEIGRSKNSDYQMETIEALISKRYAWKRPTVLISNDDAEELTQLFDRHILDRLATGGTIEMNGISQRRLEK